MTIRTRKAALAGLAAAGVVAVLAACGQAPSDNGGSTSGSKDAFLPCMVSDAGGFNDKSFNQLGKEGLDSAAKQLGVKDKALESKDANDYAPNIQSLVGQKCDLIVTVGFNLKDATEKFAKQNPKTDFAIIDDNEIKLDNVKPIIYDTAQAAFLAGYAAASISKTHIVGTFGGQQIPTVTIFMDGFVDGVNYYNKQKGGSVKVVGWNVEKQNGSFTGGFDANQTAKNTAQAIIDQNADVILPVGGPIYQSAAQAIRDSKKPIALIGCDADVFKTDPKVGDLLLTSIMKGIKPSVEDVVTSTAKGNFDNTPYVGTLKNKGVGIAPFHDYASKVPSDLQSELDTIKKGIIDGSITVTSPSSPKQ